MCEQTNEGGKAPGGWWGLLCSSRHPAACGETQSCNSAPQLSKSQKLLSCDLMPLKPLTHLHLLIAAAVVAAAATSTKASL